MFFWFYWTIYIKQNTMPKKQDLDSLLNKAKELYDNEYDYSLINSYNGINEKYPIICPKHGVFYKALSKHIYDHQGCPVCNGRFRYDTNSFIETAKKLPHCEDYTFDKVKYVNNKTKVIVTCKEHGDFEITPGHLLSGEGCPKCRYIKSANNKRRSVEEVISAAKIVHGDKYDYSLIKEYKNDRTKYPIICPIHGVYLQTMNNHIKGKQGCPLCGREKTTEASTIGFNKWKEVANIIHNNFYSYHEDTYDGIENKTLITCPKHGDFWQKANNHTNLKQGCPHCSHSISSAETEISDFIRNLGFNIETRSKVLGDCEIDILVPSLNFGIEYNGLYWHCELTKDKNYHLNKTIKAEKAGIKLFHVFEDEWEDKNEIVKSIISNQLGVTKNKIYARECVINEIDTKTASIFLKENHLQGYCPASIRLGLFYKGNLVSVMTFGKSRHFVGNGKYEWELLRFSNKINTNVIGGASKLFKYFTKKINPQSVVSYADRRWSSGNLYKILGFNKYNESSPNYYYIIKAQRVYRFNMRKSILIKKYGCPPDMTEKEFCYKNKWYRIYDCGCLCYVWKNESNKK